MSVAGIFPTVARDFVGAANAASREHDRFGAKNSEATTLAFVTTRADNAVAIFEHRKNGVLHVNLDALMNAVVLQRADHLQAGAIADVREPRIFMTAKISLQDAPVFRAIENGAPRFKLAHAIGRFLGVQLGHAPLIDILAAAHGVGEMYFPVVALIDIGEGGGNAAFGHNGVCFSEKRFANQADGHSIGGCLERRAESRATSADYDNVVLESFVISHASVER